MRRERPTSVLVIAILHLIGGTLGLLIFLCGGAFQLAGGQQWMSSLGGPQAQKQRQQQERMERAMDEHIPGHKEVGYADLAFGGLRSVMMVAAGIGLIMMRSWARTLSIAYAVLSILHKVFALLWGILFMVPGMQVVFEEEARRDPAMGAASSFMGPALYGGLFFNFIFIIYPIAVLIVMFMPSNVRAFRGEYAEPEDEGWGPSRPEPSGELPDPGEPEEGYRPGDRWGERY